MMLSTSVPPSLVSSRLCDAARRPTKRLHRVNGDLHSPKFRAGSGVKVLVMMEMSSLLSARLPQN